MLARYKKELQYDIRNTINDLEELSEVVKKINHDLTLLQQRAGLISSMTDDKLEAKFLDKLVDIVGRSDSSGARYLQELSITSKTLIMLETSPEND